MGLNKIVLIDGNNLYYRGFFYSMKNGMNKLEYCLEMFHNIKDEYKDAKIVLAFDTCKSKRRIELYPDYKSHRKTNMTDEQYEEFKNNLSTFIQIVKYAGYIVMEGGGYEADDFIAAFSSMVKMNYSVLLISSDSDFRQLISKSFRIFDPIKRILLTEERYEKIVGMKINQALDYKCIVGDTADNIKGYAGIGEKIGTRMLEQYGSHAKMIEALRSKSDLTSKEKALLDTTIYERNKQLCDLTIPMKDPTLKVIVKLAAKNKAFEKEKLHELMAKNDLSHMIKKVLQNENV